MKNIRKFEEDIACQLGKYLTGTAENDPDKESFECRNNTFESSAGSNEVVITYNKGANIVFRLQDLYSIYTDFTQSGSSHPFKATMQAIYQYIRSNVLTGEYMEGYVPENASLEVVNAYDLESMLSLIDGSLLASKLYDDPELYLIEAGCKSSEEMQPMTSDVLKAMNMTAGEFANSAKQNILNASWTVEMPADNAPAVVGTTFGDSAAIIAFPEIADRLFADQPQILLPLAHDFVLAFPKDSKMAENIPMLVQMVIKSCDIPDGAILTRNAFLWNPDNKSIRPYPELKHYNDIVHEAE